MILAVGAVIVNEHSEVLLVFRKKEPEADTWSIPGGKVDPYETMEAAVVREIKEEVGLDVTVGKLICTAETIEEQKEQHFVSLIYAIDHIKGTPVNLEPTKLGDVQWFPLDQLPTNLACFSIQALERTREERFVSAKR